MHNSAMHISAALALSGALALGLFAGPALADSKTWQERRIVVVPSRDASHVRAAGASLLAPIRPDLSVGSFEPAGSPMRGDCTDLRIEPDVGVFKVLLNDLPSGAVEVAIWRLSIPGER